MKKLIFTLIASFYMVLSYSQDEKVTIALNPFNEVKVFDGIMVELVKSDENKAEITGANTQKVTVINTKNGLKIRMKINKIFSGYRTFVKLYYTEDLNVIDVNEDARIFSSAVLEQDVLDVRAQESGELELFCQTEQLLVKAVTGGEIIVKGFTQNQDIKINTGGEYNGKAFKTNFTTISVNAGGNAIIYATKYVNAEVKAGGTVTVYGDPEKMDEKTVFGGKIIRVE